MKRPAHGGGWQAIRYALRKSRQSGGMWRMWKAMRSRNACKTCAVGMGGQRGGMVNETGHRLEVCKKSLQAMAADMQGGISDEFWQTYSISQLQAFSPRQLEECGRLTRPVLAIRGENYYRPIEWSEAIERIVARLKQHSAEETFWYFSGRSSNEAGFLLQLFARLYGTNNVNNCSYYCHQASGVGLTSVTGSGTATIVLEDLAASDLVFVIGGNPPSNHPRLMTELMRMRRRGGKVIVINPAVEIGLVNFRIPSSFRSMLFGSPIASLYVQPHIGGDLALLYGIMKGVLERGAADEAFLNEHCEGWPDLRATITRLSWDEFTHKSGVPREEIDKIVAMYAASKNTIFSWTMGITHHAHGVQNVQAIAATALMRGMVGKPAAGLLPIRGHSNVQGIGSVGVTPKLKDAIFDALQSSYNVQLPTTAGLDTLGCMEQAHACALKLGFCLGGNLYGSNPDSTFAAEALSRLKTLVFMNTTLNTGHAHGLAEETIILPVLARDEEAEPTTQESMFNFVRMSDGGPRRLQGPRSEVEVIADIAAQVLPNDGPIDWNDLRHTRNIRRMIAKVVPGWQAIGEIDDTKAEFQIEGRTFHAPQFATANKKAQLHTHELPEPPGGADLQPSEGLRLMTVRSEGQFNTVVYEEHDLYRGQDRRDVILIHPDDLQSLGIKNGQQVTVTSEAGTMPNIIARGYEWIRPGNVIMYYPEANILVPRSADPQSRTPAFKGIVVKVQAN